MISMRKKNRWGFIDDNGNEIILPQYEEVRDFFGEWAPVKKNGKWGFINTKGEAKNVVEGAAEITINKLMDYNADGDVTLQDVLAASKILSGELTVKVDKKDVLVTYDVALDVDKDGEITAADLLAILDYINGAKSYADVTALN